MAMLLPRGVRRLSELIYVPLPRLRSMSPSCSRTESACRTVWRLYPNCSESVFSDSMRSPGSYSPFLIFSLMVSTRKRYFAVFFSVSAMSSFLSKRIPVCTGSIQPYYKKPYNFLQDLSQNLYGLIFKIFCKSTGKYENFEEKRRRTAQKAMQRQTFHFFTFSRASH